MKFLSCIFGGFVLALVILAGTSYMMVQAQTRPNAVTQVQNISPIVSVQRAQCIGSGSNTVTNPDNTTTTVSWNCAGLQLYKFTLLDGTILGPYVAMPAGPQIAANGGWIALALNAPDPVVPNSLGQSSKK